MLSSKVAILFLVLLCSSIKKSSCENGQRQANNIEQQQKEANCNCGTSPLPFVFYGGVVTDTRLYPWLVSIHRKGEEKLWGYCGGSLISNDTVLTSASCLIYPDGRDSTNTVTAENMEIGIMGPLPTNPARKVAVKTVTAHPKFNAYSLSNDIAVVKLAESVACTPYTRPICMVEEDLALQTDTLRIAGWGRIRSYERGDVIRDGSTCIVDSSECNMFSVIPHKIICTKGRLPESCNSDSGTPAMVSNSFQHYVVGVASKREFNCPIGMPGFYTRIAPYYHFIIEAMES